MFSSHYFVVKDGLVSFAVVGLDRHMQAYLLAIHEVTREKLHNYVKTLAFFEKGSSLAEMQGIQREE